MYDSVIQPDTVLLLGEEETMADLLCKAHEPMGTVGKETTNRMAVPFAVLCGCHGDYKYYELPLCQSNANSCVQSTPSPPG